jgi:hypothetical protein
VVLEKMEISWTDRVRNEVPQEERNFLYTIRRGKANWIGHIWGRRFLRNGLLKEI